MSLSSISSRGTSECWVRGRARNTPWNAKDAEKCCMYSAPGSKDRFKPTKNENCAVARNMCSCGWLREKITYKTCKKGSTKLCSAIASSSATVVKVWPSQPSVTHHTSDDTHHTKSQQAEKLKLNDRTECASILRQIALREQGCPTEGALRTNHVGLAAGSAGDITQKARPLAACELNLSRGPQCRRIIEQFWSASLAA